MLTKTQFAFRCNVELLFERSARVYMWTFTFVEVIPSWWALSAWDKLKTALRLYYGRIQGIRVTELHKEHGVHFHVLINKRMSVQAVRRIGARYGFGRIHVTRADVGAGKYLAKYLTKEEALPTAGRKWATFGMDGTRVRDIQVDSEVSRKTKAALAQIPAANKTKRFNTAQQVYRDHLRSVTEYEVAT